MFSLIFLFSSLVSAQQIPVLPESPDRLWSLKYTLPQQGPLSFSHFPFLRCLSEQEKAVFDIATLGFPFDGKASYRPGARFGPFAIRSASQRQSLGRGYSFAWDTDGFNGTVFVDCGDIPLSIFDGVLALDQMEEAYSSLLYRPVAGGTKQQGKKTAPLGRDGKEHPRIVSFGGDHSIVLPILRSLHKVYGPLSVIHFDAHLDTWSPSETSSPHERVTHGTFFSVAAEEGLIRPNNIHAGIRCKLRNMDELDHDSSLGFQLITADDLDEYGAKQIIEKIKERIGNSPVYLSFDIDVIDPAFAPGTGTPEVGGWSTREVKKIIRGLAGLNFVGVDIVEVSPSYDHAEVTALAASDIALDLIFMMQEHHSATPYPGPFTQ